MSFAFHSWTTNPLVEYYIMDCNHGVSTGGQQKGSVSSDGATYAVWEHQQTNQPSIQGTSTFQQYISIRNGCTNSGTITLSNHFNAWKGYGMNLGQMNFQVIAVESWSGSGSASQSVTN
jgi:endo-1,4-beta-xylanase